MNDVEYIGIASTERKGPAGTLQCKTTGRATNGQETYETLRPICTFKVRGDKLRARCEETDFDVSFSQDHIPDQNGELKCQQPQGREGVC